MNVPRHIGIIPDGNRRCAKRLMKQPSMGHEWGVGKLRKVLDWCNELGINDVTIYSLSLENMNKRPSEELDFLLNLARKEISDMIDHDDSLVHTNHVKLKFFGKLSILPQGLRDDIKRAEKATSHYTKARLNIAMAYGGRQELVEASRSIALQISHGKLAPEDVNDMVLRQNLQTNGSPDPDLIIRTGGEKRVSNFMIFQAAYSELAFTETFWPELDRKEFMSLIQDFSNRKRRFGGQ